MADTLSVNIIYYNILAPVCLDVKEHMIVDDKTNHPVGPYYLPISNRNDETRNLFKRLKRATPVCEVCIQCKYNTTY